MSRDPLAARKRQGEMSRKLLSNRLPQSIITLTLSSLEKSLLIPISSLYKWVYAVRIVPFAISTEQIITLMILQYVSVRSIRSGMVTPPTYFVIARSSWSLNVLPNIFLRVAFFKNVAINIVIPYPEDTTIICMVKMTYMLREQITRASKLLLSD